VLCRRRDGWTRLLRPWHPAWWEWGTHRAVQWMQKGTYIFVHVVSCEAITLKGYKRTKNVSVLILRWDLSIYLPYALFIFCFFGISEETLWHVWSATMHIVQRSEYICDYIKYHEQSWRRRRHAASNARQVKDFCDVTIEISWTLSKTLLYVDLEWREVTVERVCFIDQEYNVAWSFVKVNMNFFVVE
jgi:hypothetical protein